MEKTFRRDFFLLLGIEYNKLRSDLPSGNFGKELQPPTNLKECAEIIVYYETLVEEWESWGETVTLMVGE